MAGSLQTRPARPVAVALALALAACGGGSGSTGLIVPESAVLAEVRRDGTCAASDGVTYCATNSSAAVSPGGQSANAPVDMAGAPTPCTPDGTCSGDSLGFVVSGFAEGAACASAARPSGSGASWSTGPLVPVSDGPSQVEVSYPAELSPADAEIALLCFETAPTALPGHVETLAEARPDVVFVPR
jgi:hypothetical protein